MAPKMDRESRPTNTTVQCNTTVTVIVKCALVDEEYCNSIDGDSEMELVVFNRTEASGTIWKISVLIPGNVTEYTTELRVNSAEAITSVCQYKEGNLIKVSNPSTLRPEKSCSTPTVNIQDDIQVERIVIACVLSPVGVAALVLLVAILYRRRKASKQKQLSASGQRIPSDVECPYEKTDTSASVEERAEEESTISSRAETLTGSHLHLEEESTKTFERSMDTKAEGTARLTSTTDSKNDVTVSIGIQQIDLTVTADTSQNSYTVILEDAHSGQRRSVSLGEKEAQTRDMEKEREELMHLLGDFEEMNERDRQDVFCRISRVLGSHWKQFGRLLTLDDAVLENIHADNRTDGQQEMGYQTLIKWIQGRESQVRADHQLCEAILDMPEDRVIGIIASLRKLSHCST
jgi:hypothetical protein